MKASHVIRYGGPGEVNLTDKELLIKEGDVQVRILATTVNRTDVAYVAGVPKAVRLLSGLFKPKFNTTGTDFVGEVVSPGKSTYKKGDRVWGFGDPSIQTHAEYASVAASVIYGEPPASLSATQAVACIEGCHYAKNFLNKVPFKPGQSVLLIGGTGAIGNALMQFCIEEGLQTQVVCLGEDFELIQKAGAQKCWDYTKDDFWAAGQLYDYVFDAVGKYTFKDSKSVLKEKGIYISSEFGPGNENLYLPLTTRIANAKRVKFPLPLDVQATMDYVTKLVEKGSFKPLIERQYQPENLTDAFIHAASGKKKGNIVINWHPEA